MNFGELQLGVESFRTAQRLDTNSEIPEIDVELKAAEQALRSLEAARSRGEFSIGRDAVRELLPPLRRAEEDVDEVERCIQHLSSRPGYCSHAYKKNS